MPDLTFSNLITTTVLPDALRVIYSREMMQENLDQLFFMQFVERKDDFSREKGQQVYWNIYKNIPPNIGTLVENQDIDTGKFTDTRASVTVDEKGWAIGLTEKLDLLSYNGRMSEIARTLIGRNMVVSMDQMARNAFWGVASHLKWFGGTASSRGTLTASDKIAEVDFRKAQRNLKRRSAPPFPYGYGCITHPDVAFDFKGLAAWTDVRKYQDAVSLYQGETGSYMGFRIIEANNAVLLNAAGTSSKVQTTLTVAAVVGDKTVTVASAASYSAGKSITLSNAATITGTAADEEDVLIKSISGNVITLDDETPIRRPHAIGGYVTYDRSVYPVVFFGQQPVGYGVALEPEIRVRPPIDILMRMNYVGWYGIVGFNIIRPANIVLCEVAATE